MRHTKQLWISAYPVLNLEMIMMGPKDSSLAMYMWSCTSVNTVGSKKKPGTDTKKSKTLKLNPEQRGISQNCVLEDPLRGDDLQALLLPHLVAGPVCHHGRGWLPHSCPSDSTPRVFPGELCDSEGRGLWNGPTDLQSSSS